MLAGLDWVVERLDNVHLVKPSNYPIYPGNCGAGRVNAFDKNAVTELVFFD
jgi:hypothetical protein